jgi:outer membrane lipoprotein-sorting protein
MLRAVLIGFVISTCALSAGGELEAALARMDQAAKTFKDLTADLKKTHHTAVIDENAVDSGTIFIKRQKPHELLMRADITEPDPKQYAVDGREAAIYFPKSQEEQKYKIGDYKKLADQILLLGFGTTSKELADAYTVALGGSEVLNDQKTTRLELTPKSDETHLKKVDLWISDTTGLPLQEKLYWPGPSGGDYDVFTYSNMKINPNLPDSAFKLSLPKGTKVEYPH